MDRMTLLSIVGIAVGLVGVVGVAYGEATPERWEDDIRAFEEADEEAMPAEGGVLFVGSSSIVGWDVGRWFAGMNAINRGFGGSTIADVTHFADRIVFPYEPRAIVLYSGDNDVANGMSAEAVFEDFKELAGLIHERLPGTRLVVVAIKPSTSRWELAGEMSLANAMMQSYAAERGWVDYADIFTPMLGADGKPREELLAEDGLHLSEAGYRLWTGIVEPLVREK